MYVRTVPQDYACVCTRPDDCVYVRTKPHVSVYVRCSAPWKISDSQAADSSISSALTSGFPYPPVGVTTDSFTTGDSSSPYFTLPTTTSDSTTTTTGKHTACLLWDWLRPHQCPHNCVFMFKCAHMCIPFLGGSSGLMHEIVKEKTMKEWESLCDLIGQDAEVAHSI